MTDILSKTKEELTDELLQKGFKKFKAKSVFVWLHQRKVKDFSLMTDLSKSEREILQNQYFIPQVSVEKKLVSKIDGTIKLLCGFEDGECVESVIMNYKHGNSLCISTQVGCRMGCAFCASTILGKTRDLTPAEMLNQVYLAEEISGHKVSSIVLMGIGEPLDNFENVVQFMNILSDPDGKNLSLRHLSLSTCGIVPKIYDLAKLKLGLTLSVSLHAPNDIMRSEIMAINKKYGVETLIKACRDYYNTTGRRVSFEYSVIRGVNDSDQTARELGCLLKGMGAHVNLIPINNVSERQFTASGRDRIDKIVKILEQHGITATVRRKLGSDINAACGQLRKDRVTQKGGVVSEAHRQNG